jgi:ssDNA-binding Zn-finger/Zn-ribbon topoisomerase 1
MVERRNKAKGTAFYGCKKFPHCRETLPIDGQEEEAVVLDDEHDEF